MILNKYNKQIVTAAQAKCGARAVSPMIDDKKLERYIEEATKFDITPVLTHKLVDDLLQYINQTAPPTLVNELFDKLLNGADYQTKTGEFRSFAGLESCMCYYVYAYNAKFGDITHTRFGARSKTDDYSVSASANKQYREEYESAFKCAEVLLNECVLFLQAEGSEYFTSCSPTRRIRHHGTTIKVVGD